ncbi:MAG: hypothetical protein ABS75_10785 [Pelagibacterium sp. SCN 63-23]|nr:MAG: hypothetical protein ABS75_10785 [Pelagibacterium sp. SCN 63-23]
MINFDHAVEIALLLLAAYLAGCLLGYFAHRAVRALASRPRRAVFAAATASPATGVPPVSSTPSAARRLAGAADSDAVPPSPPSEPGRQRPPELPAPRQGRPDDLKKIKGIGPKTESVLNDMGIYHFDQIAAWQPGHLDWLEGRVAIKGRIRREQWVDQAALLATAPPAAEPG